jgi:hypothetical protein
MNKKAGAVKTVLIIGLIVVLAVAVYFTFFYSYKCYDKACFVAHQEKCSRTSFVNEKDQAVWKYYIKGEKDGKCVINVKLNRVKEGNLDLIRLQGKDMNCYLPVGAITNPEADISKCSGELKEGMQEIIINNLHSYILDNVGTIDEELDKVI